MLSIWACELFRQWLFGRAASGLERILCEVLFKKTPTVMLLKTALNTIQPTNQYIDNCLPHNIFFFLLLPKVKAFADYKLHVVEMIRSISDK